MVSFTQASMIFCGNGGLLMVMLLFLTTSSFTVTSGPAQLPTMAHILNVTVGQGTGEEGETVNGR